MLAHLFTTTLKSALKANVAVGQATSLISSISRKVIDDIYVFTTRSANDAMPLTAETLALLRKSSDEAIALIRANIQTLEHSAQELRIQLQEAKKLYEIMQKRHWNEAELTVAREYIGFIEAMLTNAEGALVSSQKSLEEVCKLKEQATQLGLILPLSDPTSKEVNVASSDLSASTFEQVSLDQLGLGVLLEPLIVNYIVETDRIQIKQAEIAAEVNFDAFYYETQKQDLKAIDTLATGKLEVPRAIPEAIPPKEKNKIVWQFAEEKSTPASLQPTLIFPKG